MGKSLIKSSDSIKSELEKRIKELKLSLTDISADADKRGMKISISSLSRYFSNSKVNNLSEESIIWLAYRYQVYISLIIGKIRVEDKKFSTHIPEYNEKDALQILDKVFPSKRKKK